MIYLEDLTIGQKFKLGSISVTKEEIIEFAEKFDPQVFHLNEKVATEMYGGLIASGFHTASLCNRLVVDNFLNKAVAMASPGLDELLFLSSVYSDDTLSGVLTVVSTKRSQSKPDRGIAKLKVELFKTDNVSVLRMTANLMMGCKVS